MGDGLVSLRRVDKVQLDVAALSSEYQNFITIVIIISTIAIIIIRCQLLVEERASRKKKADRHCLATRHHHLNPSSSSLFWSWSSSIINYQPVSWRECNGKDKTGDDQCKAGHSKHLHLLIVIILFIIILIITIVTMWQCHGHHQQLLFIVSCSVIIKWPSPSHCDRAIGLLTSPCTCFKFTLRMVIRNKGDNKDDADDNENGDDNERHLRLGETKSTAEPPAESANT